MEPPTTRPASYAAARRGELSAEALPRRDQERLVRELVLTERWTDQQIAAHTRWSTYVVDRIRGRLGLAANESRTETGGVA